MKQIIVASSVKANIMKIQYSLDKEFVIYPAKTEEWMLKVLRQKDIELLIICDDLSVNNSIEDVVRKIRSNLKYRNLKVVYLVKEKINNVASRDLVLDLYMAEDFMANRIREFVR